MSESGFAYFYGCRMSAETARGSEPYFGKAGFEQQPAG